MMKNLMTKKLRKMTNDALKRIITEKLAKILEAESLIDQLYLRVLQRRISGY